MANKKLFAPGGYCLEVMEYALYGSFGTWASGKEMIQRKRVDTPPVNSYLVENVWIKNGGVLSW